MAASTTGTSDAVVGASRPVTHDREHRNRRYQDWKAVERCRKRMDKAREQMKSEKYSQAVLSFKKALQEMNDIPEMVIEIFVLRAEAYLRWGNFMEVVADCNYAMSRPEIVRCTELKYRALTMLGMAQSKMGNVSGAMDCFVRSTQLSNIDSKYIGETIRIAELCFNTTDPLNTAKDIRLHVMRGFIKELLAAGTDPLPLNVVCVKLRFICRLLENTLKCAAFGTYGGVLLVNVPQLKHLLEVTDVRKMTAKELDVIGVLLAMLGKACLGDGLLPVDKTVAISLMRTVTVQLLLNRLKLFADISLPALTKEHAMKPNDLLFEEGRDRPVKCDHQTKTHVDQPHHVGDQKTTCCAVVQKNVFMEALLQSTLFLLARLVRYREVAALVANSWTFKRLLEIASKLLQINPRSPSTVSIMAIIVLLFSNKVLTSELPTAQNNTIDISLWLEDFDKLVLGVDPTPEHGECGTAAGRVPFAVLTCLLVRSEVMATLALRCTNTWCSLTKLITANLSRINVPSNRFIVASAVEIMSSLANCIIELPVADPESDKRRLFTDAVGEMFKACKMTLDKINSIDSEGVVSAEEVSDMYAIVDRCFKIMGQLIRRFWRGEISTDRDEKSVGNFMRSLFIEDSIAVLPLRAMASKQPLSRAHVLFLMTCIETGFSDEKEIISQIWAFPNGLALITRYLNIIDVANSETSIATTSVMLLRKCLNSLSTELFEQKAGDISLLVDEIARVIRSPQTLELTRQVHQQLLRLLRATPAAPLVGADVIALLGPETPDCSMASLSIGDQ